MFGRRKATRTVHFKRYQMEYALRRQSIPEPTLPDGYVWVDWDPLLLNWHADAKYGSFRNEMDTRLFPCLGDVGGCRRLMRDIAGRSGFLPEATWLICFAGNEFSGPTPCATIQGVNRNGRTGNIQNVGVVPEHRGLGLGRSLVLKALRGFQAAGLRRAQLEVTAENVAAVQLYEAVGFRHRRTSYRSVLIPELTVATG